MDLISVIIPVYNVEKYLLRCVDSVRKQTYSNLEIILVDDGSPDRCPELCEEIKKLDDRVKVVHKENGGLGFARNSGLDVATGTYVTFIDSDDWITVDHIENLYQKAQKLNVDAVIGSHMSVTSNGDVCPHPIKLEQKIYEGVAIQKEIILPLIGSDVNYPQDVQMEASSCMSLYRLDVINQGNIRFPSEKIAISEDMFFNLDFFCSANRVAVINEIGYCYFENLSSISRKYDFGRLDRTIRFYEAMKEKLVLYGLEDQATLRLMRTFLMDIRVAIRMIIQSDMEKKQKYREIQGILENGKVKTVLVAYPIETYIPAMRLLTKWMNDGNVKGVYWLMKFREYAKRQSWLKILLKQIGIGR